MESWMQKNYNYASRYFSLVELALSSLLILTVLSCATLYIAKYAHPRDDGLGSFVLNQD